MRKILAPTLPSTYFHREQLSSILGEALGAYIAANTPTPHHLVLLCAPAGYGKTTLLAETIKCFSLTCCWFFLDRSDQDIIIFLRTLLASIRQCFPSFGLQIEVLLAENIAQSEEALLPFLDAFLKALTEDIPEHVILAFCNYQEVNESPAISHLLNSLLKRLPSQCLIVIESRALPILELAPLIVGEKLFGLGSRDLQFSAHETYEFAQVRGISDFTEKEAMQVTTAFDGWITGMLLGSRLGAARFPQLLSSHTGNRIPTVQPIGRRQLFTFVLTEVFRNNTKVYTFLKETSLLEKLIPTLCNALLTTEDAATVLEYAENQGLFVTCSSEEGELIYRCHPLLRELFQEELRRQDAKRYVTLHQQLAILFYEKHNYQDALKHALEAQDSTQLTQILLERTEMLLEQGQSEMVLHALNVLSIPIVQKNPRLLLIEVNTYLRRGDFASAQSSFERAEKEVKALKGTEYALIHAELVIACGELFVQRGDYQYAQTQFQLALELLPIDERILRIRTHQQLGICTILSGRPVYEGIAQFQQALGLCHPRFDKRQAGELHHQLANAYGWAGNYAIAEHHRQRIRALQEQLGLPHFMINNLIGMGFLKMRQGYGEEAETFFQMMLNLAHHSSRFLSSKAYALLGLGELEWIRQHFQNALTHLDDALVLARQLDDRYLCNSTLNMLSLVYIRMGDIHTAQYLQKQTSLPTNETPSYESVFSALVQGTLQLAQEHYANAQELFDEVIHLTRETGIQWLQMQALLRLAACYLGQGNRIQAKHTLQQAVVLNTKGDHDYILQVELQAYSHLQPLIQEPDEPDGLVELQVLARERLRICALGEPAVWIDTNPVTRWGRPRAIELYFFLLENNQPLRKEQIIDALWPEPEESERINQKFRSTVYYLRQVIGDACLIQQGGIYRLDLHVAYGEFWYDVAVFEEQQRKAQEAEDDEKATHALEQMINLYRGDYVQAFYSDWCIPRRDELRRTFMEAHRQLALIAWRQDAWEKSLVHWQHLLTHDPCLETAHYGAIRCYLRQGKRDLALRQYQRCRKELYEQLGAEPGSALQKLYQRIANS